MVATFAIPAAMTPAMAMKLKGGGAEANAVLAARKVLIVASPMAKPFAAIAIALFFFPKAVASADNPLNNF